MSEEPEIKTLSNFIAEFNDESERGAVLVAASRLEEMLGDIIRAFLRDGKTTISLIEGFNAPLSTFSAKAAASHAMGLITDREFQEVSLIRKIRNEFAHRWDGVSFNSQKVKDLSIRLRPYGDAETRSTISVRGRFTFAVVLLISDLMWRHQQIAGLKIREPNWKGKFPWPE